MKTAVAAAICRDCGDINVEVASITLVVSDGIMIFDCPRCGRRINLPSPTAAEETLLHHGCQVVLA